MEAGIGAEAFNNFDNQLTYKGDPILQFQAHLGFRF
jgi:hypothetical protein